MKTEVTGWEPCAEASPNINYAENFGDWCRKEAERVPWWSVEYRINENGVQECRVVSERVFSAEEV